MSLDPNKTYLVWNGTEFPNSTNATFKAPAGSTIDWGDGTVETFDTASTTVNTHTYTDGKPEHTIAISGLTSIGDSAFALCSSLTNITIPNSVTSIGEQAFRSCISLTSVTIGNGVTSIGSAAFYNCSSLTSITIPDSVTSIGGSVFYNCSSLTSVTVPNSITSINGSAFEKCSSLASITIPNNVTSIGLFAFKDCRSLTSIIIPDSVTSIGNYAFSNCSKLTQLILFPSSPPTLGSSAISNNVQSIYVQQSSKAAYQAASNWKAFATEPNNKIVSDNMYLSFVRFNQKNKEYISEKVDGLSTEVAPILSDYVDDTLLGG